MSQPVLVTPLVKPWYMSRSLWVAGLQMVILAIALVGQSAGVFHLSPQVIAAGGIASGLLLAVLRMVTNSAIAGTPAAIAHLEPPAP